MEAGGVPEGREWKKKFQKPSLYLRVVKSDIKKVKENIIGGKNLITRRRHFLGSWWLPDNWHRLMTELLMTQYRWSCSALYATFQKKERLGQKTCIVWRTVDVISFSWTMTWNGWNWTSEKKCNRLYLRRIYCIGEPPTWLSY